MARKSGHVQMKLAFTSNKIILKLLSNFYSSEIKKHKVIFKILLKKKLNRTRNLF